jgi:hypothetical protein
MHFFSLGRDDRPSLSISWSHPLTNPPSGELKEKKKVKKEMKIAQIMLSWSE